VLKQLLEVQVTIHFWEMVTLQQLLVTLVMTPLLVVPRQTQSLVERVTILST
jgi:hypothetical protein